MALIFQISNGQEMELHEMACSLELNSIVIDDPVDEIPFNYCGFRCDFEETVFCDPSKPKNLVFNDLSSIQFELLAASSTVEMFLVSEDDTETPLIDDKYGTFFGPGAFENLPLRGGYLIDWCKVKNEIGLGKYRLRTSVVNFGKDPEIKTSHVYNLCLYDVFAADGTVKIESIQNGEIEGGFNYSGMEWYQSLRVKGSSILSEYNTEVEKYRIPSLQFKQNQSEVHSRFETEFINIPYEIGQKITKDLVLGNDIYVTTYGIFTHGNYVRQNVSFGEIPPPDTKDTSGYGTYRVTFDDKDQSTRKRNP